jgi:hypothetical protein
VVATGGYSFAATEGADSSIQTVATFNDPDPDKLMDYRAMIDWGDHTTSIATVANGGIVQNGNTFSVNLSHDDSEEGSYTITAFVVHEGLDSNTVTSTATVADAPLSAVGMAVSATKGVALTNVQLGTLTDAAGTYSNPSDLSATITWGDDTAATPATLIEVGTSGVYTVEGSHTYAAESSYPISIAVADVGGGTATITGTATVASATTPAVTGVSPLYVPLPGGMSLVTITGPCFTGATAGDCGRAAASSFTVISATQITATSPIESPGEVNVTVTTPAGTSTASSADKFVYMAVGPEVTDVSPTSGSLAGGTTVTIMGTWLTGATAVDFGTVAATSFTVNSDTQITAASPAEAAGTVDVTVVTPYGTSAEASLDQFAYAAPPGPSTISWTGLGPDDLWSDAANWSTGSVPGADDNVSIGPGYAVDADVNVTVNSLQVQTGASLTDEAGIAVADGLTNSGTILLGEQEGDDLQVASGTLLNAVGGQIVCGQPGVTNNYDVHLDGNIENQGTITAYRTWLEINNSGDSGSKVATGNTFVSSGTIQLNDGPDVMIAGLAGPSDLGTFAGDGLLEIACVDWNLNSDWTVPHAGSVWIGLNSSTLSGNGTVTNPAGNTLWLVESTLNSAVVNQGTLCEVMDSTINGQFTAPSGSTLEVGLGSAPFITDGTTSPISMNLNITQGFTNDGDIDLYDVSGGSTLSVSGGALVNAADGTISSGTGLWSEGNGNALNAVLDNQGTIDLSGSNLAINQGTGASTDTFTDEANSTVDVAAGQTLTLGGDTKIGAVAAVGGAIVNDGTLETNGVTLGGPLTNDGLWENTSTTTLSGALTTSPGSTLQIAAGSATTITSGFTNYGTITIQPVGATGGSEPCLVVNGTLVNAVGATISCQGNGRIGNDDAIIDAQITNLGTITVASTSLRINGLGDSSYDSAWRFTNTGTIQLPSGSLLAVGGEFDPSVGTIDGTGSLQLEGTTVNLSSNWAPTTGMQLIMIDGAVLNGPGTLTISVGNVFAAGGATINTAVDNDGSLIIPYEFLTISGPLTVAAGSTVLVGYNTQLLGPWSSPGPAPTDANLTIADGFTNDGLIEISGIQTGSSLTVTGGTLVNAPGGTIRSTWNESSGSTPNDNNAVTANLVNQGTITVTSNTLLDATGGDGEATGTGNSFTSGGTIQLVGGMQTALCDVGGVAAPGDLGAFEGNGALCVVDANWSLPADWTLPTTESPTDSVDLAFINSTLAIDGELTNPAGSTVLMVGSTINADVVDRGTLFAVIGASINGQLTLPAGSTLQVGFEPGAAIDSQDNGAPGHNGAPGQAFSLTVSNGIVSDGQISLFNTSLGAALNVTGGTLLNKPDGTITSALGAFAAGNGNALNAVLDNQGTIDVSGSTLAINQGTGASAYALTNEASGTIDVGAGQELTVGGAPLIDDGLIELADNAVANLASLTINGQGTLQGQSTSTLQIRGSLLGDTTNVATFKQPGTVILDGDGTASAPQLLELMEPDQGNVAAGYANPLAYDNVQIGAGTFVKLVDPSDNSLAAGSEAGYAQSLVVPEGSTFDKDGLNFYVGGGSPSPPPVYPPILPTLTVTVTVTFAPASTPSPLLLDHTNDPPAAAPNEPAGPVAIARAAALAPGASGGMPAPAATHAGDPTANPAAQLLGLAMPSSPASQYGAAGGSREEAMLLALNDLAMPATNLFDVGDLPAEPEPPQKVDAPDDLPAKPGSGPQFHVTKMAILAAGEPSPPLLSPQRSWLLSAAALLIASAGYVRHRFQARRQRRLLEVRLLRPARGEGPGDGAPIRPPAAGPSTKEADDAGRVTNFTEGGR